MGLRIFQSLIICCPEKITLRTPDPRRFKFLVGRNRRIENVDVGFTVPRDQSDIQLISLSYVFVGGRHINEALSRGWQSGRAGGTPEQIGSTHTEGV